MFRRSDLALSLYVGSTPLTFPLSLPLPLPLSLPHPFPPVTDLSFKYDTCSLENVGYYRYCEVFFVDYFFLPPLGILVTKLADESFEILRLVVFIAKLSYKIFVKDLWTFRTWTLQVTDNSYRRYLCFPICMSYMIFHIYLVYTANVYIKMNFSSLITG